MTVPLPQEFVAPSGMSERFDELYRSLYQPLVKFARRRLPSSSDPEDVVQESFVKVMERIDPEVIESAPFYITKVVRNGVIGELRSRAAEERAKARLVEPERQDSISRIEENELSDAVNKLTSRLPSRQRRFISLYAIGLSPAEIAQVESSEGRVLTANQVSCTLLRASNRLRTLLERAGFGALAIWFTRTSRQIRFRLARTESQLGNQAMAGVIQLVMAGALSLGAGSGVELAREPDIEPREISNAETSLSADSSQVGQVLEVNTQEYRAPSEQEKTEPFLRLQAGAPNDLDDRSEHGNAPPLSEQILERLRDPGSLNPITCGGIPVCEG